MEKKNLKKSQPTECDLRAIKKNLHTKLTIDFVKDLAYLTLKCKE